MWIALMVSACEQATNPKGHDNPLETGETGGPSGCGQLAGDLDPASGSTDVYYKDVLTATFQDDGSAAVFTVTDDVGAEVASTVSWGDGNLVATVTADLGPDTDYLFSVDACGTVTQSQFHTSTLGASLTVDPSQLVGRTYTFRLSDAEITEPAVLNAFAGNFTAPLFFMVTEADASAIDWLGAIGYVNNAGAYIQDTGAVTWDFPAGDFSAAPYFTAATDSIVIEYSGTPAPVEDFTLSGTFAADAGTVEEAKFTGYVDTRDLGPLMQLEDTDDAVCGALGQLGIYCSECSDGSPYCLYVVGEHITADYLDGFTVVEVTGDTGA
jgi:hypothetical protein